jgi:hypothetical protein
MLWNGPGRHAIRLSEYLTISALRAKESLRRRAKAAMQFAALWLLFSTGRWASGSPQSQFPS